MIVEFIGPNGVGKRSVIHLLSQIHPGEAIAVDLLRESPTLTKLQALTNNPKLWAQVTRETQRRQLMSLIPRDAALGRFDVSESLVLIDEGPRHGLLSSTAAGRVEGFKRICRAMRTPDRIVSLEASVEDLVIRLRQKHSSHWAHRLGHEDLSLRLNRYSHFQEELLRDLKVPIHQVDTSNLAPADVAERILLVLAQEESTT